MIAAVPRVTAMDEALAARRLAETAADQRELERFTLEADSWEDCAVIELRADLDELEAA